MGPPIPLVFLALLTIHTLVRVLPGTLSRESKPKALEALQQLLTKLLCLLFSFAMDKYVTVTKIGQDTVRTSTPAPTTSTPSLLDTSDVALSQLSEVSRLSDAELDSSQLSIEGMEDNETEEDQRKRQEGTRQLKSLLEDLGK